MRCRLLSPVSRIVGIPPDTVRLVVIRAISGSAALAVGSAILAEHGQAPEHLILKNLGKKFAPEGSVS